MAHSDEKKEILKGWNTWDTYQATGYLKLPEGIGVSVGIKEYQRGQYLQNANIGRLHEGEEKIRPGLHAYDGSYTDLIIDWARLGIRITSASDGEKLVIKIECVKNDTRFIPAAVVEGIIAWNRKGCWFKAGEELVADCPEESVSKWKEYRLAVITGSSADDTYLPVRNPYLCLSLKEPVRVVVDEINRTKAGAEEEQRMTAAEADALLDSRRQVLLDYAGNRYGTCAEAWLGLQTSLAWNLIYDAGNDRPLVNVSRLWNMSRGGYGMFCWDNLFMGYMLALDNPPLGRSNAIEILNEVEDLGFVPNGSMGNGRKTYDRSQPPVGSMCVREIYRLDPQKWFLEKTFDHLLRWNRWWIEHRLNGELLSWGTEPYDNRWEVEGIGELFGAALESGLDNSPMYAEGEVSFDKDTNRMELWDVGLNSLYLYDCDALADIARVLGKKAEEQELATRAMWFRNHLGKLWNEELGIYCNYKTDQKRFSTVLTPCCFYPLMTGQPSRSQYERMMKEHFFQEKEFFGEFILPSVSRDHRMYPENSYWRGRIWAPMNFLVYLGMRRYGSHPARTCLAEKSMRLFMREWKEHGHVHENYNAENGYGDDVMNSDRNYAWGGLLAVIGMAENGVFGEIFETLKNEL